MSIQEDHQAEFAIRENEFVTRFVPPVDGYDYDNDYGGAYEEVDATLEAVEKQVGVDDFGAISLHSVVADDPSQNTAKVWNGEWEVGYLWLIQFNNPIRFDLDESWNWLAMWLTFGDTPYEAIDQLDLSGTTVSVFETSDIPDSRFHYVWLDQGVGGIIDGADRGPVERWLRAYLAVPKLAERETVELSERLPAIPGFRYSNFNPDTSAEYEFPSLEIPHSLHYVTDPYGHIGVLALAPSAHVGELQRWLSLRADFRDTYTIDVLGTRVEVLDGGLEERAYVWDDGVFAGVLMTRLDFAERGLDFIESFLDT